MSNKTATYTASSSITGVVDRRRPRRRSPSPPARRRAFEVSLTPTTAPLNRYTAGSLTWSDGNAQRPDPARDPARRRSAPGDRGDLERLAGELAGRRRLHRHRSRRRSRGLVPATQTPFTVGAGSGPDVRPDRPDRDVQARRRRPGRTRSFRTGIYEDAITPDGDRPRPVRLQRDGAGRPAAPDGDSNEEVTLAHRRDRCDVDGRTSTGSRPTARRRTGHAVHVARDGTARRATRRISGVARRRPASQTHTATFSGLAPDTRYLGDGRGTATARRHRRPHAADGPHAVGRGRRLEGPARAGPSNPRKTHPGAHANSPCVPLPSRIASFPLGEE